MLPGSVLTGGGSFASKPNVQVFMTASDKMTPDEPEKTFLSFSDKINDSVVVKSMEDQSLLINPDDKQENICLRTPSIKADDNKFVTDTVKEEAPINLNIT